MHLCPSATCDVSEHVIRHNVIIHLVDVLRMQACLRVRESELVAPCTFLAFFEVGFRICGAFMPSRIGKFVASSQLCLRRSDRFRQPDPEMIVLIRNYSCQCFTEELVCGTGKALQKHPWLHPSLITVVVSVVPLQDKFYACLQTAWPWIL